MVTMPVEKGFIVTSGFGPRSGGYHYGVDFGLAGGSGGKPIFAVKDGRVTRSGPASGFGRWVTIDHPASNGGGETVYGHIVPEVTAGQSVKEGQRIGRIDPNQSTNGGVAPHLHLEWHRYSWAPPGPDRLDPMTKLAGATWPGATTVPKEDKPVAKNYLTVQPDRVALLGRNFTQGRGGRKIRYITRHHTAGVLNATQINSVWQSRPASAHYLIGTDGTVSQHVWDRDTAWSNANATSNAESITIEHSNSAGAAQDWPINDITVKEGARWAAALCLYYGLGKPEFGRNIRDHKEFTATSCPYHLAHGGKYHWTYMREAQRFYDELSARKNGTAPKPPAPAPTPTPAPKTEEEIPVTTLDTQVKGFAGGDDAITAPLWHFIAHSDRNSFDSLVETRMLRAEVADLKRSNEELHEKIDRLLGDQPT